MFFLVVFRSFRPNTVQKNDVMMSSNTSALPLGPDRSIRVFLVCPAQPRAHPSSLISRSVPDDYIGRRNLEHVEALQENPVNPNQVVIGYGRGLMVIWDLEKQDAIQHIPATQVTGL